MIVKTCSIYASCARFFHRQILFRSKGEAPEDIHLRISSKSKDKCEKRLNRKKLLSSLTFLPTANILKRNSTMMKSSNFHNYGPRTHKLSSLLLFEMKQPCTCQIH